MPATGILVSMPRTTAIPELPGRRFMSLPRAREVGRMAVARRQVRRERVRRVGATDGLHRPELSVDTAGGEKVVMSSVLDEASVIEDEDAIGAADRRQPVRDHERGAALHQPLQSLED